MFKRGKCEMDIINDFNYTTYLIFFNGIFLHIIKFRRQFKGFFSGKRLKFVCCIEYKILSYIPYTDDKIGKYNQV